MSVGASPLVLASELHGRPVIAIDCGDDIAEIKDVIFDAASQRLEGFTLNKRGWFRGSLKASLPAAAVHAVGPDAVMVPTADSLVSKGEAPVELDTSVDNVTVIGTRVLSATGEDLGEIADVVIATSPVLSATGYKVAKDSGDVFVPLSAQRALSDNNLVLPDTAVQFIRDDLAGFGAAVESHRAHLEESS